MKKRANPAKVYFVDLRANTDRSVLEKLREALKQANLLKVTAVHMYGNRLCVRYSRTAEVDHHIPIECVERFIPLFVDRGATVRVVRIPTSRRCQRPGSIDNVEVGDVLTVTGRAGHVGVYYDRGRGFR